METIRKTLANPLSRLRLAGLFEGSTLLFLVLIAVPMKHLAGYPAIVSAAGPAHGLAFVFYVVCLVDNFSGGGWSPREMLLFRRRLVAQGNAAHRPGLPRAVRHLH